MVREIGEKLGNDNGYYWIQGDECVRKRYKQYSVSKKTNKTIEPSLLTKINIEGLVVILSETILVEKCVVSFETM